MEQGKHCRETADWELAEEYYNQETNKKELKLEDFLEEAPSETDMPENGDGASAVTRELERTAEDVRRIVALSGQGKQAAEIARELGMEQQTVSDIMVCVQAFPEDNPLAVARLIVLG